MIVYAKEPISKCLDEVLEMAHLHWCETESYRHGQGFNPDRERYMQYEKMGIYHLFTARDDGLLIGYGGVYIMKSMHTQKLIATEDTYFIVPAYRKGRIGLNLFKTMETFLKESGAVEVSLTTQISNPTAERIVEYMGYQFFEKRWSKNLMESNHVRT